MLIRLISLKGNTMKTERYTTVHTNRTYELKFKGPHVYNGTYILETIVTDYENKLSKMLNIDIENNEPDPDLYDYDLQELVAYCLLYLTQYNYSLITVSLVV